MPQNILAQMEKELTMIPKDKHDLERRMKIEKWLDSGIGCCVLRNPHMAETVQNGFLRFNGNKYNLLAWCIMPNHVHVLIEPLISLCTIVQSWKSYSARWAIKNNAELVLGVPRDGKIWMREYWDRFIRDEKHLNSVIKYIHNNPIKAGLCKRAEDWTWSSANIKKLPSWSSAFPGEVK